MRPAARLKRTGRLSAGVGGAWFSMESQGGFQDNMTNGTGFIALAALIFGRWRPWSAFAGAMLFGFTRALGTRLQVLDVTIGDFSIPSEFWQSLPYVVTIIVVAGAIARAVRDLVTSTLGALSYGPMLGTLAAVVGGGYIGTVYVARSAPAVLRVHPTPTVCIGIVAGRVDVPAERGAGQHEGEHHQEHDGDRHDDRQPLQRGDLRVPAALLIEDVGCHARQHGQ